MRAALTASPHPARPAARSTSTCPAARNHLPTTGLLKRLSLAETVAPAGTRHLGQHHLRDQQRVKVRDVVGSQHDATDPGNAL